MSPPVTLPSSAASPSAASHAAYQKAAVELDDLLDQALGDFRGGSVLGSNLVDSVSTGGPSVAHGEAVADERTFVAASRHERYRSLLAFHRWCWLLCSVEPSFLTPKRQLQANSWTVSAAFHAWVVTGSHSSARSRSRPTSPVDYPDRVDDGIVSATFGAWASDARARVQERVSLLSSMIGLWCAHTQQARHERELAVVADEISRGCELLLAQQVLVMWAAVASESAKQERAQVTFAERWSAKKQLCDAFNCWRSFSARGEADSGADAGEGSDLASRQKDDNGLCVEFDGFNGDWNHQCANNLVSPIAPSGTAFLLASPGADAEAAAESTQSARQNPALDALDDLLQAETKMHKLVAKADRFYSSRQSVRMVFFFTVWAQLRGSMTPRERQPLRTTSTTPDLVQTQTATEVQLSPTQSAVQVQATYDPPQEEDVAQMLDISKGSTKNCPVNVEGQAQAIDHRPQQEYVAQTSDKPKGSTKKRPVDVERWLMRQAGVISSSDDSSDDISDGDDDRFQGGLWDEDEDLRMVATAEFAVAAMIQTAPPAAAAVSDSADEHDDAQCKQSKHEELVDLSGRVLTKAAEYHVLGNNIEKQLIDVNEPTPAHAYVQLELELEPGPEPEPEAEPEPQLNSVRPVHHSFTTPAYANNNCSVNVADDGEISMNEYVRDWVEWYFRGEWWPACDVDVAVGRLLIQPIEKRMGKGSASVANYVKDPCAELSWGGYLAGQVVWYLRGEWWVNVARAPEIVADIVARQGTHAMARVALACHTGHIAMIRLQESDLVVGGLVLWDAVVTGSIFTRPNRQLEQKESLDSAGLASPDRRNGWPAARAHARSSAAVTAATHTRIKSLPSSNLMVCGSKIYGAIKIGVDLDGLQLGGIRIGLAATSAVMVSGAYLALRVYGDTRRS